MRIAYVIINANRHEGTARAILEVADRLAKRHEVHLFARTLADADARALRWHRVPGPGWPEAADFGSFYTLVGSRLTRGKFDVIHSAGCNSGWADVYAVQTVNSAKMTAMRAVGASRGAGGLRRLTRWAYDRLALAAERRCYRAAGPRGPRAFLPVSTGTEAELRQYHPSVGGTIVEVVPNAADLGVFSPTRRDTDGRDVRRAHGLADDDFVLVFSGGDWRRKGLDVAIEALSLIPAGDGVGCRRVRLLVAGDDPLGEEMRRLAEHVGVADRIVWAGFRSDVHRYYAAGDLFVFPTAYEAFSLASIEAAASGLPVVMTAGVSGAEDLLGGDGPGRLVARESRAVADAVQAYLTNPTELTAHRHLARRRVESRFNWDAVAAKTEAVYERLLDLRRIRGASPAATGNAV